MAKKRKSRKLESKMEELKKVNFSLLAPDAQNVSLAGDFNDWDVNTHLLQKVSNGTWEVNVDLNPGKYEYRFVVDGEWKNDPDCMSFTPNSFGSENCILKLQQIQQSHSHNKKVDTSTHLQYIFAIKKEIDINPGSMEDTSVLDHNRFKKGKKVLYDGKEAKVIGIKPLLIIKTEDRIICGALHEQVEFIEE